MAKSTYILSQNLTWSSQITEVKWHAIDVTHRTPQFNVTASGDADRQLLEGIEFQDIVSLGSVYDVNTSAFAQASAMLLKLGTGPDLDIQGGQWICGKRWVLKNTTGAFPDGSGTDTVMSWTHEIPQYYFAIKGWALTGDVGLTKFVITSPNFVLSNSIFGTLTGQARFSEARMEVPRSRGGWVPVTFVGEFTDGPVYAAGTANYDAVFLKANTAPVRGTCTLSGTNLTSITGTYQHYDVQIRGQRSTGGPVTVVVRHRKDEP